MNYMFSVNDYGDEGELIDECVNIYIGDVTSIKFKNVEELEAFANKILSSIKEIKENY